MMYKNLFRRPRLERGGPLEVQSDQEKDVRGENR